MFEIVIIIILIAALGCFSVFTVSYCCWQWLSGKLSGTEKALISIIIPCVLIFIIAVVPRKLYDLFPKVVGIVEATLKRDITGFAFSDFGGEGRCRIFNTVATLRHGGDSRIVLGLVYRDGKEEDHLWGVDDQRIIDVVYPDPSNRQVLAVVNPHTCAIEASAPRNARDTKNIANAIEYLRGFISTVQRKGK
jgi:hypothetical protein